MKPEEILKEFKPGGKYYIEKKQLAAIPEQLQYESIVQTPKRLIEEKPQEMGLGQLLTSPDVPLWRKALAGFAAPFEFVHEKAIEPFATVVTSPFTPTTPGTEGMGWFERELAEYKAWDDPNWGFLGVKGAVETLPWLAIPGVGAVAGKGGMAAGRGIAGALGRMGTTGKAVGTALEYSPWGLVEKGAGKVIEKAAAPIMSRITGKAATKFADDIIKIHKDTGGSTVNPVAGNLSGKEAYSVAVYPGRSVKIPGADLTNTQVKKFMQANKDVLKNEDVSIGTWFNKGKNQSELDIVLTLPNKAKALAVAEQFKQEAIYDLRFGKEIFVAEEMLREKAKSALRDSGTFFVDDVLKVAAGRDLGELTRMHLDDLVDTILDYTVLASGKATNRQVQLLAQRLKLYAENHIDVLRKVAADPKDKLARESAILADRLEGYVQSLSAADRRTQAIAIDQIMSTAHRVENMGLPQMFGIPKDLAAGIGLSVDRDMPKIFNALYEGKLRLPEETRTITGGAMPKGVQQEILNSAGIGRPGLSSEGAGLVYRNTKGEPVAVATLSAESGGAVRVGSVVTDESQSSLIRGKAAKAIMEELDKTPNVILPSEAEMSAAGLAIAKKYQKKVAEKITTPKVVGVEKEISDQLGLEYAGVVEGLGKKFNDPVTGNSIYADSVGEATRNLRRLRRKLGAPQPPAPPKEPPLKTAVVPDGFGDDEIVAIEKLTRLVKESKPLRKETETLYRQEHARRIELYDQAIERYTEQGMSPENAHQFALQEMAKEYPRANFSAELETIRAGMSEIEVQSLFAIIRDGFYKDRFNKLNAFTALQDLFLGKILQRNQIVRLEETFGTGLAKELLSKRTFGEKAGEFIIDLANAPRALLASCDISGLLRQGGVLSVAHPIEAMRTVRPMVEALFGDKFEGMMDNIIRSRAHFGLAELYGLYIAPRVGQISVRLAEREEAFMSRLMNKVPFVKASNRAYITGLNDLRTRIWEKTINTWQKAGVKITEQDYRDLAQFINWSTGRGTLPSAVSKQGALLNTLLFSPRLILSRIQLPTSILPMVTKSALVRKEAWRTLLTALGVGTSLLAAAAMSGAKVELDPRSADFGKLIHGNTRVDIWTGYVQYLRFAAQLTTGQKKTEAGRTYDVTRRDVIDRFAQTKLSPAVGFINDLLKGETYLGEDMPPKSPEGVLGQLYERMMPLAIQDLIDATNQDGPMGTFISSGGILGMGMVTYTDETQKAREKAAQDKYGMSWDELGKSMGRAAQLRLEQSNDEIRKAEQKHEQRFAAGTPTLMEQWQSEGKSIEDTYRKSITLASNEFRETNNGLTFKDKVDQVAAIRRQMYSARSKRDEYQDIVAYYDQPLKESDKAKMNPGDVMRKEYYRQMYGQDMYDEYDNYRFDEAERREQQFLKNYGQEALAYIEEYQGSRWIDRPQELMYLEQARELLRPYWNIEDQIWALYPKELKVISDEIKLLERTNPDVARRYLKRYPQILRARELIAKYKKSFRDSNPQIAYLYHLFYG